MAGTITAIHSYDAARQVEAEHDGHRTDDAVHDHADVQVVAVRDLARTQGLEDLLVLPDRVQHEPGREQDERDPDHEGHVAFEDHRLLAPDQLQEQPEALDHEAERHQRDGGTVPGEQGALGGEQNARVVEIRHGARR